MDKAEELKQFAKIPNLDRKWGITTPQYLFTEKQLNEFLDEYTSEVSLEAIEDYAKFVDIEHWEHLIKTYYENQQ